MDVVENFDGCGERESNGWFHRMDEVGVNEKSPQLLGQGLVDEVYASIDLFPFSNLFSAGIGPVSKFIINCGP